MDETFDDDFKKSIQLVQDTLYLVKGFSGDLNTEHYMLKTPFFYHWVLKTIQIDGCIPHIKAYSPVWSL